MEQGEGITPLWTPQEQDQSQMHQMLAWMDRALEQAPEEEEEDEEEDDDDDEGEEKNEGLTPRVAFHKNSIELLEKVFDIEHHLDLLKSLSDRPPSGGGITPHVPSIVRCLGLIFKATGNSKCHVGYWHGPREVVIHVNDIVKGFDYAEFQFRDGEQEGILMGLLLVFQWTNKRYSRNGSCGGNRYTYHTYRINDMYVLIICWVCLLKNIKRKFMTDINYPDPMMGFDELMPSLFDKWKSLTEEHPSVSPMDVLDIWALRSDL